MTSPTTTLIMPMPRALAQRLQSWPTLAAVIVAAYAITFVVAAFTGGFLYDEQGRPHTSDFINVWAAGKMVLQGHAPDVYNWRLHKLVEIEAATWDFDGYFGWHYPPPFLAIAAPLALMGFPLAHLVWMAITTPLYLVAIARILPRPGACLAALAFPAAAWNFTLGQNGFFTAALLGGALVALPARPALAGVMIGLLAYKPQFGLLIPLALLAGGHWRAIATATATVLGMSLASLIAFGTDTWIAFFHSTGLTNEMVLIQGKATFAELLSPFGMTRWLGGSLSFGWLVQGAVVVALAAALWRVWRGSAPYALKAALLAASTLMASPYLYVYDLVILTIAIAFLARDGFASIERNLLIAASLLILAGPVIAPPLAFLAAPIVIGITLFRLGGGVRRASMDHPGTPPSRAA